MKGVAFLISFSVHLIFVYRRATDYFIVIFGVVGTGGDGNMRESTERDY